MQNVVAHVGCSKSCKRCSCGLCIGSWRAWQHSFRNTSSKTSSPLKKAVLELGHKLKPANVLPFIRRVSDSIDALMVA